jgi:elongator complex protein 2
VSSLSKQEAEETARRNVYKLNWLVPPVDSQLSDYTVWPEDHKFFGHANDVMCLAVNSTGTLLASACKAKDKHTAKVMIWDLKTYVCLYTLDEHDSTIVTIRFSPNNRFLVSSGKDRLLCLYALDKVDGKYKLVSAAKNAHKRIIWDCTWSKDSSTVYTVSRDGFMKGWSIVESDDHGSGNSGNIPVFSMSCILTMSPFGGVSVTSIDLLLVSFDTCTASSFSSSSSSSSSSTTNGTSYSVVALGSETGDISIWRINADGQDASLIHKVDDLYSHGSAVKRVRWCGVGLHDFDKSQIGAVISNSIVSEGEIKNDNGTAVECLASCGEDNTVRVFSFRM